MSIIDSRKVDYLWKKLGYGKSKTDVNSIKNATNESIPSPLFLRGDLIWAQSDVIPSVIPSSSLEAVQVYPSTSPVESVIDITASPNRTWKTNSIDWIPPEIGDTYQVKVYVHTSGDAANAASNGTQLFAAGSGNNDEWFFDYQSGLLHFIGTNLPNGINFSGKSIYISGARYIGVKGVPAPGAAITFSSVGVGSNFSVTGFSTFTNTVDINNGAYIDNVQIGITGDNEIDTTTGNLIIDSFEGTVTVDDRLIVVGLSTFNSDVDFDSNVNIDSTLIVTGVSTFTGNIDANGDLDVDGYTELDTVNVSEKLNVVGVSTFGSDLDINANVDISGDLDVDGYTELDTVNVSEKLNVVGVSTFESDVDINANVDISADLDVDGYTELDTVNVSEKLNVVGVSTFGSDLDINANVDISGNLDVDGYTELDTVNVSEKLNVVGVSTFESDVDINASVNISTNLDLIGDLDVDGYTELDTVNVSEKLNVVGVSTFESNVDINASVDISSDLTVDGTTDIDELNVVGVSTFGSDVDINASVDISTNLDVVGDLDVDGYTELDTVNVSEKLNVVGVSTFGSDLDINASVNISTNLDVIGDLDVDGHTELDNVNVSENVLVVGVVTATSFQTGAEGSAIRVNSDSITGPSTITIDPAGIGDNTGLVIIAGDLQVDGTQTIINSTTLSVDDLNIMLADGAVNDAAADGGGFTVQSGDGNKTFQFEATGDNFGASEHINLATGKTLKIANTEVLRSDLLTVANAALSGVTTIGTTLDVNGDLDVDGYTELDTTNISETLNVVGLTTLGSNVDINADLDVDGTTELDGLNVDGTTTLDGTTIDGTLVVNGDIDLSGDIDVDGYTELDTVNVSEKLNVVGVSTFGSDVDINASVNISTNLDVIGDLDIDGYTELDTVNVSEKLNVVGVSTFGSDVDINASVDISGDLDVDGYTELDTVNVSEKLNVVGVSTFGSDVDINASVDISGDLDVVGDLDVDGYTELDTVNVSEKLNVVGVSTFGSDVDINASVNISTNLDVDGYTELDTVNVSEKLNVVGVSTFGSDLDINASVNISTNLDVVGDLDVDGYTELDTVNVSEKLNVVGVSTFESDVDINANVDISGELVVDGTSDLDHLNVVGLSTFASNVDINADLDVDGYTELDTVNVSEKLNVVGVSTFGSDVDINASVNISTNLDVDGYTELDTVNVSEKLNVVGVSTFGSDLDINASVNISTNLDVDGDTELDGLNVDGTTTLDGTTIDGTLVVNGDIDLSGDLDVDGYTELDTVNVSEKLNVVGVSTFASAVDINSDVDISGELVVDGTSDLDHLNVVGLSTFASNVDINASVDISGELVVDGTSDLDHLNVTGLSTFTSNVDINASVDISGELIVDGTSDLDELNVVGLSTFTSNVDINASVDISGELVVDGTSDLDHLNVTGIATISERLDVNGDLHDISGTISLDNVDVSGIVSATRFDGDLNALGNTYYVAATGSDSNSGDNINEPYLTIAKALTVATSGDIVYVGAGIFEETCPLTVPSGVTIRGAGLRATTIRPTDATKTNNIFLLSDVSTVEDFTIKGSYYNSTDDTGYSFSYASGITIATRSPYIQRVTVLNRGSVVTSDDPYGFDTADSPPTSYTAGRGAKVDGSVITSSSIEAGMLFNEVTFFTPNQKGVILTNGARAEYLNCFHYFASQAICGVAGTTGIGGNANTKLRFSNPNVTPSANDIVKLFNGGGVGIATGQIVTYSSDYATISGLGTGTFTSVGTGTTQDIRFFQADGTTQTGVADSILLADYTMFGAEMRSVGCAVEYGTQGVVADGNGVKLRMFATNFNHVGSGKDFSNDTTLTIQANEVVELNSGTVSYVSIDQSGDFRVGDSLFIDQETGNVSFAATSYSLDVTGTIDVTDGTDTSTLTPTSITVGGLQLASNQLSSLSGDITIDPSGSSKTIVQGNLDVNGTLNASVVNIDAIQRGDTSISIADTGTDGTIIFYTENNEAFRANNSQQIIFTGLVDINGGGQADTFKIEDLTSGRVVLAGTGGEIEDSANLTFNGSTLNIVGDLDVSGTATIATIDATSATIDNLTFTSGTAITSIDTDLASVSASDDTLASAKAIRTYVDAQVTAQDLDISDGTNTGAVDLDSQSLTIAGTPLEIETSVSGQTITVGLTDNISVSGIVTSNAGFAGTTLTIDGTGYVLKPGASVNDTSQLYNTNLYDSLGRPVTTMTANAIHFAGVADGLTGEPDIHVGIVTAGQVTSNVGFAGTILTIDGTGYVLKPGASVNDTSQLYNTNLYDSLGRPVTTMTANAIHFAGVADGLTGTPDIEVGIVTATHLQVTGVSTFANTVVSSSIGSPVFNTDYSSIGSIEFITTGTSQVVGHILDGNAFRSVEYLIQAVDGAQMHLTKILAIHDGAGVVMTTEYGTVFNNVPLASYEMIMNGPNAELLITATTPNVTTYRITFTAIAI
jgi:cytoskeletal protein CcmA (bactofilin family)